MPLDMTLDEALLAMLRDQATVIDDPEWGADGVLVHGVVDVHALATLALLMAAELVDEQTYVSVDRARRPQSPMEIARVLRRMAVDSAPAPRP